ncbi:MAG: S8 family peptidase [Balneolaceae bacterium]|nr:S8 family peptidase [Balneolaceae bacterium]
MLPFKKILFILITLLVFSGSFVNAQNQQQRVKLQQLSERLGENAKLQRALAIAKANREGIPLRNELEDGTVMELMRFENGFPIYYSTANAGGASLINTDEVYSGGNSGLSLSGSGQVIGLWDAGKPRLDHVEYSGRVTVRDGSSNVDNHASRVTGTLIATGVDSDAKGMAFEASVDSYNFFNDISEMSGAAGDITNPLLNSVHPYQINVGWSFGSFGKGPGWYWYGDQNDDESFFFGYYDETTRDWDKVAHFAPNYTIVVSAGNQRGEIYPDGTPENEIFIFYDLDNNGDADWESVTTIRTYEPNFEIPGPDGGTDGYKSISGFNLAKNVITVGSVNQSSVMSSNSSWGPTDDGRIKPDIVAKGVSVFSSSGGSNTSYSTSSGTSFSAPMISGSAGLLLEHQENLNPDELLLSSTIRGLIIHTAEDLGNTGPDYEFGWGLMNTEAAARVMSDNVDHGLHIHELSLHNGDEVYINVRAKGNEPLRATLAWTDPPINEDDIIEFGTLNDPTPMLVNDLDLRIFNGNLTEYQPFILDPANPGNAASNGDNFRDNVEMVHIQNPAAGEIYTIRITHKGDLQTLEDVEGNLVPGSQNFSLIVTGNEAQTFTLDINEGDGEGWRFISSPVATMYSEFLSSIWTQGPANSNAPAADQNNILLSETNVIEFNGASSNYVSVSDLNEELLPGKGVAVYVYADDNFNGVADSWPKSLSTVGLESISPFQINTSNGLNPGNEVFSLLGNPFNSAISFGDFDTEDINSVVYVYDHACDSGLELDEDGGPAGGCFRAWNGVDAGSLNGGRIAAFQGFFVIAAGNNPEIVIPETAKTDVATDFYKAPESVPVVQLQAIIQNRYHADTWFSFSETGSKERNNFDAPYLYPMDYKPFMSFYSEADGQSFNIKNLPLDFDDPLEIPIHIEAWQPSSSDGHTSYEPLEGQAEIFMSEFRNVPSNWTVTLRDNITGNVVDFRESKSYKFYVENSPMKLVENLEYNVSLSSAKISTEEDSRFSLIVYPYPVDDLNTTELPEQLTLSQNYPNPFNPSTLIRYELPAESNVTLDIYSIEGQRVATLINSVQPAGVHSVRFDGSNLASGVYLYRLTAGNSVLSRKMILIK